MVLILADNLVSYVNWLRSKGIPEKNNNYYFYWDTPKIASDLGKYIFLPTVPEFTLVIRLKNYELKQGINEFYEIAIAKKFIFIDASDDVI